MPIAAAETAAALVTRLRCVSTRTTLFNGIRGLNVVLCRRFSLAKLQFPVDAEISVPRVRLLRDGKFVGDFNLEEAKQKAQDEGLNLILFRPRATPPVCVLARYQEFVDQQQRALKGRGPTGDGASTATPSDQTFAFDPSVKVKAIQISAHCAESDFARKIQSARKFLESGNRVEIVVFTKSSHHKKSPSLVLSPEDARRIEAGMGKVVASASARNVSLSFSLDNPLIQRVDYIYAQLADIGRPFTLRSKVDMNQRQLVLKFWPA